MTVQEQFQAGVNLHKAGKLADARAYYRQVLSHQRDHPDALHLLGVIALQTGDPQAAIESIARAIVLNPNQAAYHANIALALLKLNRKAEALGAYQRSVGLNPTLPLTHFNMGNALAEARQFDEAIACLRRAVDLAPNLAEPHKNTGDALRAQGNWDDAEAAYRRALALRPDWHEAMTNLGVVCRVKGDVEQAIRLFDAALARKPDDPAALWNKGLVYLMRGEYEQGWPLFEWRLKALGMGSDAGLQGRRWDGCDLAGKRILIQGEQGFGDALQFARFVPEVARRGGRIVLSCRAELAPLFRRMEGVSECVPSDQPLPPHDLSCPLLSLAGILGVTLANLAAPQSYLTADAHMANDWANRLAGKKPRKVGLVWSGQSFPNPFRSLPPEQLEPLRNVDGIDWISLQTGDAAAQPPTTLDMLDAGRELKTFDDTAAVMACLDLVITIDTAAAHLAGALGIPTWVLVPRFPDWRWGRAGETCPWYPTMRLFRQEQQGDWKEAIERIITALGRA